LQRLDRQTNPRCRLVGVVGATGQVGAVVRRLLECLGRDRTKHQVAEVTSLGLVQMTRKRVGSGLLEAFSVPCEHCNGRGVIVSLELVDHVPPRGRAAGDDRPGKDDRKPKEGRSPRGSHLWANSAAPRAVWIASSTYGFGSASPKFVRAAIMMLGAWFSTMMMLRTRSSIGPYLRFA